MILALPAVAGLALTACGTAAPAAPAARISPAAQASPAVRHAAAAGRGTHASASSLPAPGSALPRPAVLTPFGRSGRSGGGQGKWTAAGRGVGGVAAVYETTLVPPGGSVPAGLAWMDTGLLTARLYSGSMSPGGGPYRYTAPVSRASARSLVAAFNGGFLMKDAHGGYYTEGRMVDPLRTGAASLVIYADGRVNVGAWGSDVTMTPQVVSVRQNLVPLVAGGRPVPRAGIADFRVWGSTCAATSCGHRVPGVEHQWRSGLGITAGGALVYAAGAGLDPLQLAQLLARAGVVRGMELDINPYWPVFAAYDPAPGAPAAPSNGRRLVSSSDQGPGTFFEPSWARDFITMSARSGR
jgi:hypothetical protein